MHIRQADVVPLKATRFTYPVRRFFRNSYKNDRRISHFYRIDAREKAVTEEQAYSMADYYEAGTHRFMQYLTSFPTILPSAEAFAAWRTSKRGRYLVQNAMTLLGVWTCTMQDTTRQDAYILASAIAFKV